MLWIFLLEVYSILTCPLMATLGTHFTNISAALKSEEAPIWIL